MNLKNPSFNQLIKLDNAKCDTEKIGCLFKRKLTNNIDFYNNSFHLEEGLVENFVTNFTSECFNDVEGEDFGCQHFYNIFSCFKKYYTEIDKESDNLEVIYTMCTPLDTSKEHLKCVPKCVFEQMRFYDGQYFNTTKMENWFRKILPPSKQIFMTDILRSCYRKTLDIFGENEVLFNCNYFYRYSSCYVVSVLKGFLDMAENPPKVKGFKFDL